MSNSMSLQDQKFAIKEGQTEGLFLAVSTKLKKTHDAFTEKNKEHYKYLPTVLKLQKLSKKIGFELQPDKDEQFVESVDWHGLGMLGGEDDFLKLIAPFVVAGSYIEMLDEYGTQWRYVFDGESMKVKYPKIVWED